jgi:hypothetical protein
MFSAFRNTAIGAAALAFAAGFAAPARADFIFDLTVSGPSSAFWTGSGSIDFTTASGTSTADVAAFSFHVATGDGSPQNYNLADINTISWSINSSGDLSSLLLSSDLITFGSGHSGIVLTNESGTHGDPCDSFLSLGSLTCDVGAGGGGVSHNSVLTATPAAAAVPEPASPTLLAVGLAGLGMVVRLRRTSSRRDQEAARMA